MIVKRTRLRPISKARRKLMAEVSGPRAEYLLEVGRCIITGGPAECVDEIASGPSREAALSERCAWLGVTWLANSGELTDARLWGVIRKLVAKALQDPSHYNRVRVNELRGREPDAIAEVEVVRAAYELGRKDACERIRRNEWTND